MKITLHALWHAVSRPSLVFCWIAVSAAVAIAGPFGTFEHRSLPDRLMFWGGLVGLSIVLFAMVTTGARRLMTRATKLQCEAMSVVILSAICSPLIFTMVQQHMRGAAPRTIRFWQVFVFVALISVAVFTARRLILLTTGLAAPEHDDLATPSLLQRLAEPARGVVQLLSANDHYVRVLTDRGEETILMRFADAIAELDGLRGIRVHRSHWVSIAAVGGSARHGGRVFLVLENGEEVPVSRKYRPEVEAAGLL